MAFIAKKTLRRMVGILLACLLLSGCEMLGSGGEPPVGGGFSSSGEYPTFSEAAAGSDVSLPVTPSAAGIAVWPSDAGDCSVDASNISDGYFMANYTGAPTPDFKDIKVTVKTDVHPGNDPYIYNLRQDGEYEAFPLSDGDGSYLIQINRRTEGNSYAILLSVELQVTLEDPLAPFLVSSQYVNFDGGATAVKFARDISSGASGAIEKVDVVYEYITGNIDYDQEFAANVLAADPYGYVPDIDETLRTGKGICFDYAALMAAMLRSRGIPTKMVHGWAGTVYHAWVMVYTEETGWIGVVEFDGEDWVRMDPTFASSGDSQQLREFIGDGSNYVDSYWY